MEIDIHGEGNEAVIDVSGRMVFGAPIRDVHDAVRQLVGQGHDRIVVNLGEVPAVDSSGLEVLIAAYVTCTRGGAGLSVVNANSRVAAVFHMTKLDELLGGAPD